MDNTNEAIEALNSETVVHRLGRVALWAIGLIIVRLLLNNTIGFFINREYVIASTQTAIPKVGSTVSSFLSDQPLYGFALIIGEFAMKYIYPIAMAFFLIWFGWKIASWAQYAGYAAATVVYYVVGPQAIQGNKVGINGLPYYIFIPFISFVAVILIQLIYNKIAHGSFLHTYVKPCFNAKDKG